MIKSRFREILFFYHKNYSKLNSKIKNKMLFKRFKTLLRNQQMLIITPIYYQNPFIKTPFFVNLSRKFHHESDGDFL